jgi:hypothetical protein
MLAYRSAVTRLPYREPGGAGVTMPIFMSIAGEPLRKNCEVQSLRRFQFSILDLPFAICHWDTISRSMTDDKWKMVNGK